ncbi:AraC family transcriptional regulator [Caldibacillus lycopersici]|uniref:AraC family transcriptional regulator n=1 Tax=Perspicuibacillus lycopersici TaxID=1325689 RepID=A0AAE3LP93_9BACI|nr:AraC family transcriptional regulator [Perspicuibacillus lycopersici]MCU9614756.1 AraC family transcriptional regulator [Perspicuibacillus lycopersici]
MEGLRRLITSIDYIEENLLSKLAIDDIASVACMSKFHFQRSFHMLTGVTVAEYIRKRRLTLAAQDLLHSNQKVIDVAWKYGYESPEAFTKAFRSTHGIAPSAVRKQNRSLVAYPKISFHIQIKGEEEMKYRIMEKDEIRIVGKGIRTTTENGQNHQDIPAFWEEVNQNGLASKLIKGCRDFGLLGVCMEFDQEQNEFTYFIGAESNGIDVTNKLEVKVIPKATWAVFPVIGPMPSAIEHVWERIFSEWFPSTGYEHAGGYEFEMYPVGGDTKSGQYFCEIWIPIIKK